MPKKQNKKITKDNVCVHEHNIFHKLICHHIHKRGHKAIHLTNKAQHHLTHLGELLLVGGICLVNIISSGFAANTGTTLITDHTIVASNLVKAEAQGRPFASNSKIISMRTMDGTVDNSFYPGYCTYGAARISPDFFPFIEDKKQQRTWGGNAINRCENAQATGYKIGSTPAEGALIVYDRIAFGHVGRVMYYNASKGSLIVRDMNRTSKFTMTDRREDTSNDSIKCYIYNKKSTTYVVINTTTIPTTGTTATTTSTTTIPVTTTTIPNTTTNTTNTTTNTTTIPVVTTPTTNTTTNTTTTTPTTPNTIPEIIIKPEISVNSVYSIHPVDLNFDTLSESAKHFLTQRKIEAQLSSKETIKVGDTMTLTLTIRNLDTQAGFEGLLNLPFEFITSNDNIVTSYSSIQLIKNGKIEITLTAKNKGDSTLLINFDGDRGPAQSGKIGKINLIVN